MKAYLFIAISVSVLVFTSADRALGDDHTIAEIRAAWEETATKAESCRFSWTETRRIGTDAASSSLYSLFLKKSDHFRLERTSRQFNSKHKRNITESYVSTFNGHESRNFYGQDFVDALLYPSGFASFDHCDWDNYHVLPVLLAVRPINKQFSPFENCEYVIAAETVEVAGRKLLELRPSRMKAESQHVQYFYFVDPERNFAIARVIKEMKGRKLWQLDLSNRLDELSECWVPDSWELHDESTDMRCVVEDVQADLDVAFTDQQFAFQFPKHTLITDRTFTKPLVYMLREDGRKRVISSEERRNGIHYMDYLAAVRTEPRSK